MVAAAAVVMIVIERIVPGRSWPRVKDWWLRALALNAVQVGSVFLAGVAWDGWMVAHRPWSADALGTTGGALVGYLAVVFVYHWNVTTPYWLGFVFQRPESHLVHHQRGLHAGNSADLPLIDMLFGTFHNPRDWDAECGFADDRELRPGTMLLGTDVNPRSRKPSRAGGAGHADV